MGKIFRKESVLTIPNLLSVIRIAMIPFIIWTYIGLDAYAVTTVLIIISGLTDVTDGFIARKFGMVSDVGKMLDPFADKLTQFTIVVCIATRYPAIWAVVGLFIVKELFMLIWGLAAIKKYDFVNSAKWYGKVNTLVLYTVMSAMILFYNMPITVANILIIIAVASLIMSMVLYGRFYILLFKKHGKQ